MLEDKYGDSVAPLGVSSGAIQTSFASNWWKDLMHLEGNGGENWFISEVSRKMGDGMDTSFGMIDGNPKGFSVISFRDYLRF